MKDKDNQISLGNLSSSNMVHYIAEPALFIAVITASIYFIGYIYYSSFFSRLSIQTRFINIGTVDYMTVAFLPIILLGTFIAISFDVDSDVPKNRSIALRGNLVPIVILAITFLAIVEKSDNYLINLIFTVFLLFIILFLIYASYKKVSIAHVFRSANLYNKSLVLLVLFLGLFMLASFLGDIDAKNLIQGKVDRQEIQFFLKDKMNTQLQDKTFIFIMLQDNKYYVVDKNETASQFSKLYIIPTDEVEMATVYTVASKVNGWVT